MTEEIKKVTDADIALIHSINEEKLESQEKEFVDWEAIRRSSKTHWTELVEDASEPFPVLLKEILQKVTLIPRMDEQAPLIMSGLSMWSVACSFYPIFACISRRPGAGKSKLCELVAEFYQGITTTGSDITASGIKRKINNSMFHDPSKGREEKYNEKSCVFIFDDIMPELLMRDDGLLYTLLKRGIERTGTVEMAAKDNPLGVITFYVGCPKWVSSVSKFWLLPRFNEMQRRVIHLEFKHFDEWKESDHSEFYGDATADNVISVSDIDWEGLAGAFSSFWNDPKTYLAFADWKTKIKSKRKHGISREHYQICSDLMATGLTCGYWENLEDALTTIREYWESAMRLKADSRSATVQLLEVFIQNVRGSREPMPVLNPKDVKVYLDNAFKVGELDISPTPKAIEACMAELNYRLTNDNFGQNRWFHIDG